MTVVFVSFSKISDWSDTVFSAAFFVLTLISLASHNYFIWQKHLLYGFLGSMTPQNMALSISKLGMPTKKKNYVDRETVPKEGRGVAPFPYKNHC